MSGVLIVTAVMAAIEVAGSVEKGEVAKRQAAVQEEALRQRQTEERIAATQKTVARDKIIQNAVGHQVAAEASSGFELNSPSFQAITMDDFNKFSQTRSNDELELNLKENQLQSDIDQTKLSASAQIWGTTINTSSNLISQSGALKSVGSTDPKFGDAQAAAQENRKTNPGLFDKIGV